MYSVPNTCLEYLTDEAEERNPSTKHKHKHAMLKKGEAERLIPGWVFSLPGPGPQSTT